MMAPLRLLLDTHVFLWWKLEDPRLAGAGQEAISRADVVFVSAASAWEVAIKQRLGKIRIQADFRAGVEESGFLRLPVGFEHAEEVGRLPDIHRDPFDRMLVAQARVEGLTLVSHDRQVADYEVGILSV